MFGARRALDKMVCGLGVVLRYVDLRYRRQLHLCMFRSLLIKGPARLRCMETTRRSGIGWKSHSTSRLRRGIHTTYSTGAWITRR